MSLYLLNIVSLYLLNIVSLYLLNIVSLYLLNIVSLYLLNIVSLYLKFNIVNSTEYSHTMICIRVLLNMVTSIRYFDFKLNSTKLGWYFSIHFSGNFCTKKLKPFKNSHVTSRTLSRCISQNREMILEKITH